MICSQWVTEWVTSEPIELSGDSQKYGTEAKPQTYLQPLLKLPKDSINDFWMILTMSLGELGEGNGDGENFKIESFLEHEMTLGQHV